MAVSDVELFWRELLANASEGAEIRPGATYRGALDSQLAGVARDNTKAAIRTLMTQRFVARGEGAQASTAPQPAALTPKPGDEGYELVGEVARGGMAVIHRAKQKALRRDIAIKVPLGEEEEKKFIPEALVTARLEHPNIVPVYDLTTTPEGEMALAMKLVSGRTWQEHLDGDVGGGEEGEGPSTLEAHLEVLLTVANAVAFAHSRGIVHLDIKPENVLLGAYGEVLVVDWGLALDYRDAPDEDAIAPHKSALQTPCGTPHYIAPELAAADVDAIGPHTDVYLLGATLYHVATGRPPHDGPTVLRIVLCALMNDKPVFEEADDVPPRLRAIIETAMAKAPEDRYPTVEGLQEALRGYLTHRQSLEITARAAAALERCRAAKADPEGRSRIYSSYAEAVAGFREAQVLWPENPDARAGELEARLSFARTAADYGDLGLARSQAELAVEAQGETPELRQLLAQVAVQIGERRRSRVTTRRLRRSVWATLALLVVGLAVGAWLINAEAERAKESRALAETRLTSIQRLSDVKRLADLEREAEALWPALPAQIPGLEAWLDEAGALFSRLPGHVEALHELGARGEEDSLALQWERETLESLIAALKALPELEVDVRRRLELARVVRKKTIDDQREAWDRAIAAVAKDPRFEGFALAPQLGLVPLGADPATGLQEFAHLASGEVPQRGADGALTIDGRSAIVLVLLPGGTFKMGAEPVTDAGRAGMPNVDPRAKAHEAPVHEVRLAPFLMGKYEVTQGQWVRATSENPAAYLPGKKMGDKVHTLAHPIEQVRWREAIRMLRRLDLTLPTEAQWEYATRAGTATVYWTGDDKQSLQGALNIADAYCRDNGGPESWRYEDSLNDGYVAHAPVGSYRANAFGLHDTMGNVWEWCLDRYGSYELPVAPGTGERKAREEAPRVFRGGGFRANSAHARSADRYSLYGKDYRAYDVGLRAARAIDVTDAQR